MAQLPGLAEDTPQGATLPVIAPAPTDFGLGEAAATLETVARGQRRVELTQARVQARQDKLAIQPAMVALNGALNDHLAKGAATYDGAPGFVDDQANLALGSVIDQRAQLVKQGASPGQLAEFDRAAQNSLLQHSANAYAVQTKIQAAPIAEAWANAQTAKLNGADVAAQSAYAPAVVAAKNNYTSGDPVAFRDGALAQFDQATAAALETLPPNLQPAAQARFLQQRHVLAGDLVDFALQHQQAGILKQAGDQARAAIDTIVTAPGQYDAFMAPGGTADKIVGTLPAGLRDDARMGMGADAAEARVRGLLAAGQGATAEAELKAGRFDAYLKPDKKEELWAAVAGDGPDAVARSAADATIRDRMDRSLASIRATGRDTGEVDVARDTAIVGAAMMGKYVAERQQALDEVRATGPLHGMTNAQLGAIIAAPEPLGEGAEAHRAWQGRVDAAKSLVAQRQSPGAWVMTSTDQTLDGRPLGVDMQAKWQTAVSAEGSARAAAFADYASTMLRVQAQAGIPVAQREVVPAGMAAQLATAVNTAPPEGRLAALQGVAKVLGSMPSSVTLADGSVMNPRALLSRQLAAAGLSPAEASGLDDFGGDPAKMGRVVAAVTDTGLKAALAGEDLKSLRASVVTALAPFLNVQRPLPGASALEATRVDRTEKVAEYLMARQGMTAVNAAKAAAADLAGGYRFVDTWMMPSAYADQVKMGVGANLVPYAMSGSARAQDGARAALSQAIAGGLAIPSWVPAGTPAQRRDNYVDALTKGGRWVSLPDGSGLTLMTPHGDGTFDQVADRYGRPVRANWDQLWGAADGRPLGFGQAPPAAHVAPGAPPMPAMPKPEILGHVASAVTQKESAFRSGLRSPAGALGLMQIMPKTAAMWAPRLGLALDLDRLRYDDAYNQRFGTAILSNLLDHYGYTPAGMLLTFAAYNWGQGHVDGYTDKFGAYHPGLLKTIGDPRAPNGPTPAEFVARTPVGETRDYMGKVMHFLANNLSQGRG